MVSTLTRMGMPSAFSAGGANFTGMEPRGELYISQVRHQAVVEIDEQGTEAAAATMVVTRMKSIIASRPVVFRADHPFVFVIWDNLTQSPLFVGRVVNPLASAS